MPRNVPAMAFDERTRVMVSLPISVWISGACALLLTVGTVAAAWRNIGESQAALAQRQVLLEAALATASASQTKLSESQERLAGQMGNIAQAVAELRGQMHPRN